MFSQPLYSQQPTWQTLPNSPTISSGRFEDIYFINAKTGWTIEYAGKIYSTTDGGNSWITQFTSPYYPVAHFRSLGFIDSLNGWMGTLDNNRPLYSTSNGGLNWNLVQNISGASLQGVCGIAVVNSSFIYGCGRWDGDPRFIKTTNGGLNWTSIDMSTMAGRLIDCHFWSSDTGILVGSKGSLLNDSAAIFFTSNGGLNWVIQISEYYSYQSWGWKISFPNVYTGYVSIEMFNNSPMFFKSTDKGVTWVAKSFLNIPYDEEGIGFVNANTGWIGGWTGPTYETTNGGDNWHQVSWGYKLNRIRFLSDTLAYAAGTRIYKYTKELIGIQPISNEIPQTFNLSQNYPNPFNPTTKIKFSIPSTPLSFEKGEGLGVRLIIYDLLGREVATLVNEKLQPGTYEVEFDGSNYSSGMYFYKITTELYSETKKMVLVK